MSDDSPKFSLRKEIEKRQTQKILRQRGVKSGNQPRAQVRPAPTPPAAPSLPSSRARAPAQQKPDQLASNQYTRPIAQIFRIGERYIRLNRKQGFILAISGMFIMLMCVGVLLITAGTGATAPSTPKALPLISASNTLEYLKRVGFPTNNVKTLTVPDKTWTAQEAVQLEVQGADENGRFLILSYEFSMKAGLDAFRVDADETYRQWKLAQFSNVLVLTSPDTATSVQETLISHLTQYIVAPYRKYIPTATPTALPQ